MEGLYKKHCLNLKHGGNPWKQPGNFAFVPGTWVSRRSILHNLFYKLFLHVHLAKWRYQVCWPTCRSLLQVSEQSPGPFKQQCWTGSSCHSFSILVWFFNFIRPSAGSTLDTTKCCYAMPKRAKQLHKHCLGLSCCLLMPYKEVGIARCHVGKIHCRTHPRLHPYSLLLTPTSWEGNRGPVMLPQAGPRLRPAVLQGFYLIPPRGAALPESPAQCAHGPSLRPGSSAVTVPSCSPRARRQTEPFGANVAPRFLVFVSQPRKRHGTGRAWCAAVSHCWEKAGGFGKAEAGTCGSSGATRNLLPRLQLILALWASHAPPFQHGCLAGIPTETARLSGSRATGSRKPRFTSYWKGKVRRREREGRA